MKMEKLKMVWIDKSIHAQLKKMSAKTGIKLYELASDFLRDALKQKGKK